MELLNRKSGLFVVPSTLLAMLIAAAGLSFAQDRVPIQADRPLWGAPMSFIIASMVFILRGVIIFRSFTTITIVRVLRQLAEFRGWPDAIVLDNGTALNSMGLLACAREAAVLQVL